MRLVSRLIFFSLFFSYFYSQTNYSFVITNLTDSYKIYNNSIQYDRKKIENFSSIGSKLNSAFLLNRSYGGMGQVNTISMDGGLSSHTKFGWNGHNIDVAQMNSLDISLLPIEFAGSFEIYRENLSPYGIFGQGGYINFLPLYIKKNTLLDFSVESYDTYSGKVVLSSKGDGFLGKAGFSFISSSNSYPFIDRYGVSNSTYNLDFKRMTFFSEMSAGIFNISLAHTYKNGGTGVSYNTTPRQEDVFDIAGVKFAIFDTFFSMSIVNWENNYLNSSIGVDDKHINTTFSFDASKGFDIYGIKNNFKPVIRFFNVNSTKISNQYSYEIQLIYNLSYSLYKFDFDFSMNNVYRKDYDIFLIPSFGVSFKIMDGIKLFSSISRGFLFPSFNDLYWPDDSFAVGNTNLIPEDGLRWQGGGVLFFPPFYLNTSYTESYIVNQIVWKPDSTQKWTPQNIGKVFSRVFNFTLKYEDLIERFRLGGELSFSYNFAINNDESSRYYQKRILYIPLYKWSGGIFIIYDESLEFNISHRVVSERFTTEDNTSWLNPYSITDLFLRFYVIYFAIENLFDTSFEEISGYPQKGRVYKCGVMFEF